MLVVMATGCLNKDNVNVDSSYSDGTTAMVEKEEKRQEAEEVSVSNEPTEESIIDMTTELTAEILTTEEELIIIPDLVGTDESVAQTVLLNNGLIPVVDYTYSDYVDIGKVVSLSYEVGQEVPKNTNVTIYISKGREKYYCTSYSVSWSNSNPNWSDSWNVTNAYIEKGILYIYMTGNLIMDCMWTSGGQATVDDYSYTTVTNDQEYVYYDMDVTQYPALSIDLNQLNLSYPNISSITLNLPYECMNGLRTYTFTFNFVWQ